MIIHDSNHLQECVFCDKKISDFIDDEKMMKMFKKESQINVRTSSDVTYYHSTFVFTPGGVFTT